MFRDGAAKGEDYTGPRVAAGIMETLEKLAGPATIALFSGEEVKAFVAKDPAGGYLEQALNRCRIDDLRLCLICVSV